MAATATIVAHGTGSSGNNTDSGTFDVVAGDTLLAWLTMATNGFTHETCELDPTGTPQAFERIARTTASNVNTLMGDLWILRDAAAATGVIVRAHDNSATSNTRQLVIVRIRGHEPGTGWADTPPTPVSVNGGTTHQITIPSAAGKLLLAFAVIRNTSSAPTLSRNGATTQLDQANVSTQRAFVWTGTGASPNVTLGGTTATTTEGVVQGFSINDATVAAAPVAEFTASTTTPRTGQAVSFTDLSTNSPTSWAWDFGDGGTSTLQNPSHTYTIPGTYAVTLTATNGTGSDGETKAAYIVASASTYYVSAAGSDSNNGLTTGAPFLTIGAALAAAINWDTVALRKGDTFRMTGDAEINHSITVSTYGTGAAPRVDGGALVTGWTLDSGATYKAALASAPTSDFVWYDGVYVLTAQASIADVRTLNGWYWDGTDIYVHIPDGTAPTSHTVEVCRTNYLFVKYGPGVDDVIIEDVVIAHAGQHGIFNRDNNDWTVDGCTVEACGQTGIHFNASANAITGAEVTNNTVRFIGRIPQADYGIAGGRFIGCPGFICTDNVINSPNSYAIRTDAGTYHCTNGHVANNEAYGCYSGMQFFDAADTLVENNVVRDGTGFGFSAANASDRIIFRRNRAWNLANTPDEFCYNGIDINSTGSPPQDGVIEHNTIAGVCATCCTLEAAGGAPNGWTVRNNIFDARLNTSTSGGSGNGSCLLVANGVTGTFRNNAYIEQLGNPSHLFYHMGVGYKDFAQMLTVTGETGAINPPDPVFVNAAAGDYNIGAGSPCIDAGIAISGVNDSYGGHGPDIGALESALFRSITMQAFEASFALTGLAVALIKGGSKTLAAQTAALSLAAGSVGFTVSSITPLGTLGIGQSGTASTTLSMTTTTAIPAYATAVLLVAADNLSSANGNHNEHLSVTDSGGGLWSKLGEDTTSQGAAADGATVSTWVRGRSGSALPIGSTVQVLFNGSPVDKACSGQIFVTRGNLAVDGAPSSGAWTPPAYLLPSHIAHSTVNDELSGVPFTKPSLGSFVE